MPNYIVTAKKLVGHPQGSVIELDADKAATPLYRNRVRLSDNQAKLEVATPAAGTLDKDEVIKKLKEAKIDFDGRKSAEELAKLLPKE